MKWLPRLSPLLRLSLGLTSLVVSLVLFLDLVGVLPDRTEMMRQVRQRTSESLAVQAAATLQIGDVGALLRTLREVRTRDAQILSVALRRSDGVVVVQAGEHEAHWVPSVAGMSTTDHVRVPIYAEKQRWGDLEISYTPIMPKTLLGWLRHPTVALMLALGGAGLVVFYLYLRRALQYLDPTTAVPDRVRRAFDALADGVVVLDQHGRIVLANGAFKSLHPAAAGQLLGCNIDEQQWLTDALQGEIARRPWALAMRSGKACRDVMFDIPQPGGEPVKVAVGASPVHDPRGAVRGCLVTFDDVTELHRSNERLQDAVTALDKSREQIRAQNDELRKMATRDPLTGCMNRRAFFDILEELYLKSQTGSKPLCCIMADIDHFKSFNDRYGHAVGDDVIRAVVRTFSAGLRNDDVLCRYGGEEFCIVLPGTDITQAQQVAERLRVAVEAHAGSSVRTTAGLRVTSSFGVAALGPEMRDPAELIARADEALYRSKREGRNRVSVWQAVAAAA
jgi:diguanylate cyclase (GGDEF)-like protein/PAS domain S-box-containing protein